MPQSMLTPRAIAHMRKLQKDLFQTGFAMADPTISVTFSRFDLETEEWVEIEPQEVLVRWRHDKKLIRVYGGMSTPLGASPSDLDGMFMAFEPFDVAFGDRFTFSGVTGRITKVWPARNSKRRASFTVDGDKRPVP